MRGKISKNTFMLIIIPFMVLITVVAVVINALAAEWNYMISKYFGQSTYRIEDAENSIADSEYYSSDFADEKELEEHCRKVAYDIEADGMVLLENDVSEGRGLPLSDGGDGRLSVSLFSVSSVDFVYGGSGSGSVNSSSAVDFKTALESAGAEVNPYLWDLYLNKNKSGYKRTVPLRGGSTFAVNEVPWSDVKATALRTFPEYGDAALVVLSRTGCEGSDLTAHDCAETESVYGNSGNYLELTRKEYDMLLALDELSDNIILIVNSNNPVELGFVDDFKNIRSVLWTGGVGHEGLYAVADALSGKINPSGRLADTYACDAGGSPAAVNSGSNFWIENYPEAESYCAEADQYIVELEGIYVGYRYYETRYEDVVLGRSGVGNFDYASEVVYPFGYGLSYTTFGYDGFAAEKQDDGFNVSITVTNTGDVAGKDVVQIYGQAPYTDYDIENGVEKSSVVLLGFAKTGVLRPGNSETVTVRVEKSQFASYDSRGAGTYIADAGDYYIAFGTDAHSALNNILAFKGCTVSDGMTSEGNAGFVYSFNQRKLDAKTYSRTEGNAVITNKFDAADITYYTDGRDAVYLSRSDWEGTWPEPFADYENETTGEKYKKFSQQFISDLSPQYTDDGTPSYSEQASQTQQDLNLATLINIGYKNEAWEDFLDRIDIKDMFFMVRTGGYGNPENELLNIPATVAKDGPSGISAMLIGGSGGTAYPNQVVVASTWNIALAEEMGIAVGNEALFLGVQGWYAPALNIHRTAFGGRNFEYYSEDGLLSGKMGAAVVAGAQSKGLVCYVKHFALNDTEAVTDQPNGISGSKDGIATFACEQAIREIYLKPFEYAVKEGGAKGVMNAFNRIGTVWCGHHSGLQRGVLRGEWGFEGCIITDNAGLRDYMEIKAGLQAGTDLWMNANPNAFMLDDDEFDDQLVSYIREAAHHSLYVIANSAAMNGLSSDTRIVSVIPPWQWWLIGADIAVLLLDICGIVLVILKIKCSRYEQE